MGYRKDRDEFLLRFGQSFPEAARSDALALLRASTSEQRWNETACSFDIGERETARQEKREERRHARVKAICAGLGCGLEVNGDPRGWPFALLIGERQHRLGIPANGLPARCFQ